MNFNTSVYPNAVVSISQTWDVSEQAARVGQMIFLVLYAFGCELWAPWSEEYGRWPILQLSLFLVNIWSLMQSLAPNYATMIVGRALAGLSSAGGSVTLGLCADLWSADTQQYGVAYVVWSSVTGTTVGPIVGGFLQSFAPSWRWIFWIQLIFGGFTQVLHLLFVPETRSSILLDREAKRRRQEAAKAGKTVPNIWGPNEVKAQRITMKDITITFIRPFEFFLKEPIVLFCSLLSGFSDMLIFIFLESYNPVFEQWNFKSYQVGLAFIPVWIGYFIGWGSFLPFIRRDIKRRKIDPYSVTPESRLYWLLYTAPLEAIGLFGFAWTSLPPEEYETHWIAPMIFAALIGIANYCIYMATIDYMVAAYGPYSSSATGGNGFARDLLAGISAMFSTPFYSHFKGRNKLTYPSTILACIAAVLVAPIFMLYFYGPTVRRKSRFAQSLNQENESTKIRKQVRDEKALGSAKHIEHSA
ncbi:multidrug transporter [Wallemia mellicola CBS 633.66]|uniref:Multidrug transporter n=1 Tax=Wallemia mellicola (strain ATCC MYA-4683 / CBS 633.66) TaxID=671144 RepID=I4Y7J3_WALMC|nr:multidrug transporter [Wallemia mellicola CBS 633.66]EIM19935.1 multidrug transporter [Wallemia mellicola CBS 633.66]|eukprot:XP_006960074.1 multidrug transporter [Wallemia mellicola CBS 633.66]